MFKRVVFFLFLITITHFVKAQHTVLSENKGEVGLLIGSSFIQGDISPDVPFYNTSYGLFLKKQMNSYFGIRLNFEMQQLAAYDVLSLDPYSLLRDASFATNNLEGSLMTEFNFLNFVVGSRNKKFTPYLGFGVGYLYNLKTFLNVNTGVNNPSSKLKLTFPLNLGFKLNVYRRFNVLAEATYRYTTMDDIDFLSSGINVFTNTGYQGNVTGNDRFISAKLGISYTFNRIYGMEKYQPKKSNGLLNRFKRK